MFKNAEFAFDIYIFLTQNFFSINNVLRDPILPFPFPFFLAFLSIDTYVFYGEYISNSSRKNLYKKFVSLQGHFQCLKMQCLHSISTFCQLKNVQSLDINFCYLEYPQGPNFP